MSTTLYQLELDQAHIDCGMSYVFHMEDGRFFIIDGGYFTEGEQDRLYDFLISRCEGKPVIAGWFFSHAHQDHIGNFIQFVWKYGNDVTIQKLLFHFHPADLSQVTGDWKSSDDATMKEFYHTLEEYCRDVPVITPQTGDRYQIGEITIDVLYTCADLLPTTSCVNDYSTVITTTVAGQKILWLGDAETQASRILLEGKQDILKSCEIIQVAHHGFNGATRELYAATHPHTVLWPSPAPNFEQNKPTPVNHFILNDLGAADHIVSGYGDAELSLPYTPGTAKRSPKRFQP